jgi:hypothetical protein
MPDLTSRLVVRLIDGVSGPARTAARSLAALQAAGRATVALGTAKQIAANATALQRHTQAMATAVSAPMAIIGAIGAKTAFEFEKAGNMLEALGEATAAQRHEFEKIANVLNAKYPQSATEIIRTGTELLKAGLDWKQMLGAMDSTLATAILGDMKPSDVATIIAASLNAFQMPKETVEQATRSTTTVADRISYAAVRTTASLRDMGEMFKYVAGAAGATGSTIDDVTAIAMAFAQNKVVGSEAGVALRSAIVRMVRMPKGGLAALQRAGLNLNDYIQGKQQITSNRIISGLLAGGIDAAPLKAQIDALVDDPALQNAPLKLAAKVQALLQEHMKSTGSALDAGVIAENVQDSIIAAGTKIDLLRFFTDLKKKMAEGTASMGDISQIFEGRHFARMQAVLAADLDKIKADIVRNAEGFTAERYKIAIKGIVGPVYELTAALEGLAVALGKVVFPSLITFINQLTNALKSLSETSPETLKWLTYIGAGLAVLAPLGFALGGLVAGFAAAAAAVKLLIGAFILLGGWAAAIVIGLAALSYAIYANWDAFKRWAENSIDGLRRFNAALIVFEDGVKAKIAEVTSWLSGLGGNIASAIRQGTADLFSIGAQMLQQLWDGMKSKLSEMLGWASGIGARIKGALTGSAVTGQSVGGETPTPRALGGNVSKGRAYVVGERRRELFFPGVSGTVHPTTQLGGGGVSLSFSPVFNIDGAQDAQAVAQETYRLFEARVRELFRGLQADAGLRFA